jgi:uncharacterized membrane-anchored protein YjiN (DUF445 family)
VLRFIADAFAVGRTRDEIREALTNGGAQQNPTVEGTEPAHEPFTASKRPDQVTASLIDGEREQRELMWQMIRELSRFGDAIERQHYILSELVDHVFHNADRQLPSVSSESSVETVVDADVVLDSEAEMTHNVSPVSQPDVEALRKALETERDLVNKLRQSKLELERRAASAESELENKHEQEPGLLRRLFERDRGR